MKSLNQILICVLFYCWILFSGTTIEAPSNEAFRPPSPPKKPPSQHLTRAVTVPCNLNATKQAEDTDGKKPPLSADLRFKYTKSPIKDVPADLQSMWNPNQSVNTF